MKIGIFGAGSIGLLFGAYLSKNRDVTLYTRTVEQATDLNKHGIILLQKERKSTCNVTAIPIDEWEGKEDFIIVAVKQYQLGEIINKLINNRQCSRNILFLQNGMSHLKQLKSLEGNNLFVGSVEHGANKINSYTVRHNGEGVTNIAVFSGEYGALASFSSLVPVDFPVCIQKDYYEMLLNKLVVNAVINPLTAILQVENGLLLKNEYYYSVLKVLFNEISSVLDLDRSDVYFHKVIDVCQKTALNRSSMLKDMESGRKTEVDAILGFLLEEAQKHSKNAPVINSLYLLVKGTEHQLGETATKN